MLLWLTSGHSFCKLAVLLLKASQEPAAQSRITDSRVEPLAVPFVRLSASQDISDSIWDELWLAEFGRRRLAARAKAELPYFSVSDGRAFPSSPRRPAGVLVVSGWSPHKCGRPHEISAINRPGHNQEARSAKDHGQTPSSTSQTSDGVADVAKDLSGTPPFLHSQPGRLLARTWPAAV